MKTIDRDDLKRKIDGQDEVTVIEVLPRESFEEFHLPGAINIPIGSEDFEERVAGVAGKNDEIIVYCKDTECDASSKAARRLEDLGYSNVADYAAGKDDWRDADLPVE